jgi:O-acetylhomoserine/O-acetylserine sulfhydrylase-like pyridoxal-dependent enzyme
LALKTLRKDSFGGMLTFRVEGGFEKVKKVINNLKLASHLANLGSCALSHTFCSFLNLS